MSIEELLDTLSRYDSKRKVLINRKRLNKINELRKAKKLQNMSLDILKKIARLRRIKDYDNLTREDLTFSLLKSEINPAERNYVKYFNNSTDDEIKSKIIDIRMILSRLGNIVTKNDRKKIKKSFMKYKKDKTFRIMKKKRIMMILLN